MQISRLLHAHEIVLKEARTMARLAAEHDDQGTNDLLVSDVIRTNELQVWFVSEHVVDTPVVRADWQQRERDSGGSMRQRGLENRRTTNDGAHADRINRNRDHYDRR